MKRITRTLTVGFLSLVWTFTSWCQNTRIDARVEVHDPDGRPIEAATVLLGARHYGPRERSEQSRAETDPKGIAELSVIAQSTYHVSIRKTGYYPTVGPHRAIDTPIQAKRNAVGTQTIRMELRPLRNPIRGISKVVNRLPLPAIGEPVGYDLLAGDWVAPHGKGSVADFILNLSGYARGNNDFDLNLTLAFSQIGDGVQVFKTPPNSGSTLKFPYEAPFTGYEPGRTWRKAFDGKTDRSNADLSRETNYIFRARSERDEKGNVVRAMYGVIIDEVEVFGTNETGFNVTFAYNLNPDWTRNLEFDPATAAMR